MVGNVGDDVFGKDYSSGLERESIDTSGVRMLEGEQTGVSNIIVDQVSGENRILFTANANYKFGSGTDGGWDLVPKEAEIIVFQMEIPLEVVSTYISGVIMRDALNWSILSGPAQHAPRSRKRKAYHLESCPSLTPTGLCFPRRGHPHHERDRIQDPGRKAPRESALR